MSSDILLESGTNELEIVEFEIQNNHFGINVLKVKEIVNPIKVTSLPNTRPEIEGIIELRGEVLPVINLAKVLNYEESETPEKDKFIVTEFNQQRYVFHVHNVTQIHRISWEKIEKPTTIFNTEKTAIIGLVEIVNRMVVLLDFEKIITDMNPKSGIHKERVEKLGERKRINKKIVIAEDSLLLRKLIKETLSASGFENLDIFEDGKQALDYLEGIVKSGHKIDDVVHLVITDIEMPQMDGHHLTKRIKDNPELSKLPVIIFSSLITDDLRHKGNKVGANAQVSKPEIDTLVNVIDELIL